MTHLLLRLLLCLCLVVQTSAGAWAATAMAMPATPVPAQAMPCHDMPGMDVHAEHAGPDAAATPHHDAPPGCDAGHCDCLQHCSQALAMPALIATLPPRVDRFDMAPASGQGTPSPYRPVRPPIA